MLRDRHSTREKEAETADQKTYRDRNRIRAKCAGTDTKPEGRQRPLTENYVGTETDAEKNAQGQTQN